MINRPWDWKQRHCLSTAHRCQQRKLAGNFSIQPRFSPFEACMTMHILLSGSVQLPPQILPLLADGDAVLLLGDGVYLQAHFRSRAQLYLRQQDLQQRGIQASTGQTISDEEWVALTLTHQPVVSWS
ncbi:hypothetical protein GJQ55_06410 [Venatoribacter cucullus]|uniref:Protein TusB n=2 Tax=Venatoribacter cucullus TaxID=2661630 RepID=A0A9X7UZP6_9GAMM|nr:hypothetical protein GJQ55_06410 [Venatoribacter cucullus]